MIYFKLGLFLFEEQQMRPIRVPATRFIVNGGSTERGLREIQVSVIKGGEAGGTHSEFDRKAVLRVRTVFWDLVWIEVIISLNFTIARIFCTYCPKVDFLVCPLLAVGQ